MTELTRSKETRGTVAGPEPPVSAAATAALVQASHLDPLADGLLVIDGNGRLLACNPAAARLLGHEPDAAIGRAGGELLRCAAPGERLLPAAGEPASERELETLVLGAGGEEIPARVAIRPFEDGGALVLLHDLSSARRLEQALRRRERLAVMGQLIAGVAHEVRNPLAGISSSAQVLLGRFEPRDDRARFVRTILDEVNRLDRIVTRLLQYVRPSEARLVRDSLEEAVKRLLTGGREWLAGAHVEVETAIAPDLPEIWYDRDLLHQVLLNLVTNAVQAMPEGGTLRLEVRAIRRRAPARSRGRRSTDHGDETRGGSTTTRAMVQLRVVDTGQGVPREALERLFDPFYTTKSSGTGLGLSICQSIVQEHGGTLEIASKPGHGTTVILELPVEKRQGERRSA